MTAGLVRDHSSRATNVMYSSVVFALILDWAIWGVLPGTWSAIGGLIVVSATFWGAMQNGREIGSERDVHGQHTSEAGHEEEGGE
jgi:drug/metabolite transporter (DMT)-like permease